MANTPKKKRIAEIECWLLLIQPHNEWSRRYSKDVKYLLNQLRLAQRNCANWRELGEKYYDLYHGRKKG